MFKKFVLGLIKSYQWVSRLFLKRSCRFHPTCSQYMLEAVQKYGIFKGIFKGCCRVAKCHPWHPGGIDLP